MEVTELKGISSVCIFSRMFGSSGDGLWKGAGRLPRGLLKQRKTCTHTVGIELERRGVT